jgi:hypothetical protein
MSVFDVCCLIDRLEGYGADLREVIGRGWAGVGLAIRDDDLALLVVDRVYEVPRVRK